MESPKAADDEAEQRSAALEREMRELVRRNPLPMYMIRLRDAQFLEANQALANLLGDTREDLLSTQILDRVKDPEGARKSFSLLASGVIDSYVRRARYQRPDGIYLDLEIRYSTCIEACPRRVAIGQVTPADEAPAPGTAEELLDSRTVVLGTVDGEWRIDRITSDVQELLDLPPETLLGRSAFTAIHPEDVATLLLVAAHAAAQGRAASGRLRLRGPADRWIWCRISLHELVGSEPGAFAFAVAASTHDHSLEQPRAQELEDHLRRIAHEIASSGVAALSTSMPTALEMPKLSELTSREYEIVVRLARGERVGGIARSLFLSESTVRNHLTAVYRKLGVGSQAELVARLRTHTRS